MFSAREENMSTNNHKYLWVENNFEISAYSHSDVVGNIRSDNLTDGLNETCLECPRHPLPPQTGRKLPADKPSGLKKLYELAKADICSLGFDPDALYLYTLYQSGWVMPGEFLRSRRGHQWHFDFTRNLCRVASGGQFPVVIEYSVSTDLPTVFTTALPVSINLPVQKAIEDTEHHAEWGECAEKAGMIFQPQIGQVVRYDSLVLHRGEPNRSLSLIHRVFMHAAFSPTP
jgi:hypothetical protein